MAAIHQQKREIRREIVDRLTSHYKNLTRENLESLAVQLARIVTSNMTLRELQSWLAVTRSAMTDS